METFERKETKYLVSPSQYARFLELAGSHLVPAEYPEGDVASLYYDTPDDVLINRSLAGPKYKEKLRVRSYGAATRDSQVYVEVKKKFKGIVYKRRVNCTLAAAREFLGGMPYEEAIERWPLADAGAQEASRSWKSLQVAGEIAWMRDHYEGLAPKMLVSTHRTSLVGADDPELRITFDSDVRWQSIDAFRQDGTPSLENPFAGYDLFEGAERILEVKCVDAFPLWLIDVLNECGIRPQSVSKYGRAYQAAMAMRLEDGGCAPASAPAAVAAAPASSCAPASRPASHPAVAGAAPARTVAAAVFGRPRRQHRLLSHLLPRRAVA